MKTFFKQYSQFAVVIILSLIQFYSSKAADQTELDEAITGLWQTTLEENGSTLIFILEIETTVTDSLMCTIHVPEFGMSNLPYGNFLLQDDSIKLPGFEAILINNTIKGRFGVLGIPLDIEFSKIKEKPEFTINCPEKDPDWEIETGGAIWSSPTIYENQLLFGNDLGSFYSINIKDKSTTWTFECDGAIHSKAGVTDHGICFGSDDGYLYMIESGTGKLKWKVDVGNAASPRIGPAKEGSKYDFLCSSPTIEGDMIYIGSKDSILYAINVDNGSILWEYKTEGIIRSTPAVDKGIVYFGSWDHYMYALDRENGSLVWKYDAGLGIQSSPLVVDDMVVFGSRAASVFAVNKETGKEIWKTRYWGSWVESSPVYYENKIYVGSSDFRKVVALEPSNGKVIMSTRVEGWAWPTPAITEEFIFTGTIGSLDYMENMHGIFYAFERKTGKPVWQFKMEDDPNVFAYGFASSSEVWNDWVFVGGLDGKMYGMKVK